MPKAPKQKQKLLYIAQYLMEHTDETHFATTPKLIAYLEANGIRAERKSIYDDIATLCNFGFDIVRQEGAKGGYFMASRDFELAEVKLLVDLVQSSKFITTKKSRELIQKLEKQVSQNNAAALQRQVVVTDRNKTANENIYYSVDVIYEAIAKNIRVRYQYFEWDANKQMKLRKNGEYYDVSPWLLTWDDENYYLVAFDSAAGIMKHYRVDKMLHIELKDAPRDGKAEFDQMDIAAFSKKTFGMFAGTEYTVRLICDNSIIGVVVDRFGQGVAMRRYDDNHVLARADVQVSPQFFGWLAGLGDKIRIESPQDVAGEYTAYLNRILQNYK
jgi:predicted DNA-binding transcriptional regulator YafY